MTRRISIAVAILSCAIGLATAAQPPRLLSYQGVLRGADGTPLDGTFAMAFRFYGVETGGQPILADQHDSVSVAAGLFSVRIGSGVVSDGEAPGYYADVAKVFGDHQNLYLELEIAGEVLAPRTPLASAGYAFNARFVNGVEVAASVHPPRGCAGCSAHALSRGLRAKSGGVISPVISTTLRPPRPSSSRANPLRFVAKRISPPGESRRVQRPIRSAWSRCTSNSPSIPFDVECVGGARKIRS